MRQLGIKNDDLTADNFGRGIVGRPIFFIIFKIILFLYWATEWMWRLIQFYIIRPAEKREVNESYIRVREYPDYMTNWGDTMIMLYLTYSTILAIWLFSRTETTNSFSRASPFKWYYYPAQILFQVASNHAFLITILYFVLLGGGDLTDHLNVHAHVMNTVIICLEVLFNNIPFRFFHFLISIFVSLIYILGNYIGFKMNPARNGTYPTIIDWTDNDAGFFLGTIETMLIFGILGNLVLHLILWGLIELKFMLARRFSNTQIHNEERHEMA